MIKAVILASEFPPQPGGIGNHSFHLAKGLQENGFKVKLICDVRSKDGLEEREFDKGLSFEVVRIPRKKIVFLSYLNRVRNAFKLTKEGDMVISSGKFSLWVGALLSVFFKRRFVGIIHGSEVRLSNPILRKITDLSLKRYNTIIAVSNYTKSLLLHLDLKEIFVIPNGFKMTLPLSPKDKNKPGPILITVGNVTKRKGQHNVINAMPVLLKKYPDLKYHIVGIPTEQSKLEKSMLNLGVESSVIFFGKVKEDIKLELLQQADIFVMLSESTKNGDVEGFGIAILEANAVGIPAIGANNCGIEDAIRDGFSGKLIINNDSEGFLVAMEEILDNYEDYSKEAKLWSEDFTWEKIIKKYLNILKNQD